MAKTRQIVECVPNFSEGRDKNVIRQITDVIEECEGVKLLNHCLRFSHKRNNGTVGGFSM